MFKSKMRAEEYAKLDDFDHDVTAFRSRLEELLEGKALEMRTMAFELIADFVPSAMKELAYWLL